MRSFTFITGLLCVLIAWQTVSAQTAAPRSNPAEAVDASAVKIADPGSSQDPVDDLQDPAFDRYINTRLLQVAVESLDAALLTDVGLQLAEGERILLRPHKAASADQILKLAAKAAGDKRDNETLTRIKLAAERLSNKDLVAQVDLMIKTSGESRGVAPAAVVAIDSMTVEGLVLYNYYLDLLRRSRILGDQKALAQAEENLKLETTLSKDMLERLKAITKESRDAVPQSPSDNDRKLQMLANASRGPFEDLGKILDKPIGALEDSQNPPERVYRRSRNVTRFDYVNTLGQRGFFQRNGNMWVEQCPPGHTVGTFKDSGPGKANNTLGCLLYDAARNMCLLLPYEGNRALWCQGSQIDYRTQWLTLPNWQIVGHNN